jgi:hypothetical protein
VVAHLGPPQIRACPTKAPGSSGHDFAAPPEGRAPWMLSAVVALRWGQGSVSLASLPPAASWPGTPFPRRGPSGRFPRVGGPMKRSDSPSPVPPRFVAFARPVSRSHPRFAPMAAGCAGHGPGVGDPVPPSGTHREGEGASQVPGGPRGGRAPLSDPGGTAGARPWRRRGAAFCHTDTTSVPASVLISGLNHAARPLAVSASRAGPPRHRARLASGCWPSSAGRGSVPRRVPTKGFRVALPPFPSFPGARPAQLWITVYGSGSGRSGATGSHG